MRAQIPTFLLASLVAVGGCDRQSSAQPAAELPVATEGVVSAVTPPAAAPAASSPLATSTRQLTRVHDVSEVCMVNNQFMGRAQIPVVVEGKTYFGCCEMCKGRLAKDATARVAKDPVSGNAVDKSSAVIAKREDGQVLYFENAQNLERFQTGAI
jgi:YHS domain-containing protein